MYFKRNEFGSVENADDFAVGDQVTLVKGFKTSKDANMPDVGEVGTIKEIKRRGQINMPSGVTIVVNFPGRSPVAVEPKDIRKV